MGIALKKPQDVPGRSWPAIVIGLFVATGGVLYGYDTGNISGILAMRYFKNQFSTGHKSVQDGRLQPDITSSQESLIVSILSAGTFLGALLAAQIADRIGRRWSLIASSWVFISGVILQTIATALPMFISGRFFAGTGVGLISALIPLYQSETAPKWIRGVIVGSYQFAITVGLLLAAVVDNACKDRTDTGSYRIPVGVQFVWVLTLMTGMFILPETPRFLVRKGKTEEAARVIAKIRRLDIDHIAVREDLDEISIKYKEELSLGKATYSDCIKGGMAKRLLTGCLLQGLQQLSAKSTRELKILDAFDAALWFCHTVNSASTLVPGRSTFSVPGSTIDFSYAEVLNILGVDARRFFRTYADDIAEANKRVLASYDPSDPVSVENWSWLMDVATSRGLARFPHLAHDSADACLNLNMSERVALAESKALVIGSTANIADTAHANDRVPSAPMPRETRPK